MTISASPTPGPGTSATPGTAPVSQGPGTTAPQGDATTQGAPEADILHIDPNTLPPEARAAYNKAYNDMLRDYKTKTTNLSEREKSLGESERNSKLYEALLQDSDFVNYWEKRAQGGDGTPQRLPFTQEEWQAAQESPEAFYTLVQKMNQPLQQRVINGEISEVIAEFAEEIDGDGQKVRPLFYELEEAGLISQFMAKNPAKSLGEYAKKLIGAYEWAKGQYDRIYAKGKEEAMNVVRGKVGNSTQTPGVITTPDSTYQGEKEPRKWTTREAWEYAKQGKKVPGR